MVDDPNNKDVEQMKTLTTFLVALPLAVFSAAALAGDAAAGKAKADSCMDCHAGEDFQGMTVAEIADAIRAGLKGEFKHPAGIDAISEADADDVAAFFAAEAGGE
jgi:cytochrome c553